MQPARVHGGPDAAGAARWDFSTNANACGPCPAALAAVQQADAQHYPDPSYAALRLQLAGRHAVDPGRVVVAASASEFILRITTWAALRGFGQVRVPLHAYGDYAHAAQALGLPLVRGAGAPGPGAGGARTLAWACDPSSPLGEPDDGGPAVQEPGAVLVLDRAYEPLRLQGSCALARPDAVWQLWSPNKALGLTGVRAAYAIAPEGGAAVADELEALAPSWPLGGHGLALLQAWCTREVTHWLEGTRATLRSWKARQLALCADLGWEVHPGCANFMVARAPGLARALPRLRAAGVQLRDCSSFGLPGQVRLAVLGPAAQDALASAWRQAVAGGYGDAPAASTPETSG